MRHRDFIRSLTAEDKRTLTAKTDTYGLIRVAVVVVLMAMLTIALLNKVPFWPILLLPQGLLLISLFHLLHECIHDTPFRTQRLNSTVGAICGFILLLPCEWFRYFHRDHHRYTQIQGKDPELDSPKPKTTRQWLLHVSGFPVFKSLLSIICKCTVGNIDYGYIPNRARQQVVAQARAMTVGYTLAIAVSLFFQSTALLWIWVVPLVIGQPFLRLYLLAEHTLCDTTDNMFLNTRTVLTNPVVRWFTWNMPYHTEHHVYPAVPFHQLPELHKKMNGYLMYKNEGYGEFNRQLYETLD